MAAIEPARTRISKLKSAKLPPKADENSGFAAGLGATTKPPDTLTGLFSSG